MMICRYKPTAVSIRSFASVLPRRFAITATKTLACLLLMFVTIRAVQAASIDASVTISSVTAGGGVFDYTLTLNNLPTSTSSIETLWYSWIPGADFMSTNPISTFAPSGWAANVEHAGPSDGYSVQYTTSTAPLSPNGSLQFGFSSFITPTELAGHSPIFSIYLEDTTFLYSVSVESGNSEELTAETIPEPSTLALVALGTIAGVIGIVSRKLRSRISKQ